MITTISNLAQAQQALGSGARWLHLTDPAYLDAIIPEARNANVILTLQSDHRRVLETLIHGVILGPADTPAAEVRELLGPHAIIGCRVASLFEIMNLAPLDVDFFVLDLPAEQAAEIIALARAKGVEQRIATPCPTPGADAIIAPVNAI